MTISPRLYLHVSRANSPFGLKAFGNNKYKVTRHGVPFGDPFEKSEALDKYKELRETALESM